MESRQEPSLEVLVLRGVDSYMAVVLMSGESFLASMAPGYPRLQQH